MSWVDAERYCAENYQARLVSVETAAEYEVIRAQMNADQQGQEWWSGGNDLFRRNDLIWAGTGRAVNSTASGILLTGADGNGRCVQLRPQQRDMNAVSCELQLNFICETGF
ncbi:uncharacterized protein LOC106164341 [Lingula anatina]|uniref:Uncharacterized protein LOC106164341 n=1 Tax=Lingula anatina TaxID=7574 RepID=A0A1S3IHS5_LINAN|nr:uncharacterized protein LOC106164341 [Lingula anatina]|eukprot:XP_013397673.1 uncharacterized protein LOC106164341 [Lingula anatina]